MHLLVVILNCWPLFQPLAITNLIFVSIHLPILDISYKWYDIIQGEPPKKQNDYLEGGIFVAQASLLGECARNSPLSVYQLVVYERLHWASVNIFCEALSMPFAHFMMRDRQAHLPTLHTVLNVQQFLTKNDVTPMPHPPYSLDLTLSKFFCLKIRKCESSTCLVFQDCFKSFEFPHIF